MNLSVFLAGLALGTAVTVLVAGVGALSLCVGALGDNASVFGSVVITFSPINLIFAVVFPATAIADAISDNLSLARASLVFGAAVAAVLYAVAVYGMHNNMKRTFMMTVRRLAGTN